MIVIDYKATLNDHVYFVINNSVYKGIVHEVNIQVSEENICTSYITNSNNTSHTILDENIFLTIEDALEFLTEGYE